jgi:hypothetical protein
VGQQLEKKKKEKGEGNEKGGKKGRGKRRE